MKQLLIIAGLMSLALCPSARAQPYTDSSIEYLFSGNPTQLISGKGFLHGDANQTPCSFFIVREDGSIKIQISTAGGDAANLIEKVSYVLDNIKTGESGRHNTLIMTISDGRKSSTIDFIPHIGLSRSEDRPPTIRGVDDCGIDP